MRQLWAKVKAIMRRLRLQVKTVATSPRLIDGEALGRLLRPEFYADFDAAMEMVREDPAAAEERRRQEARRKRIAELEAELKLLKQVG